MGRLFRRLRGWSWETRRDVLAISFALRDPRTPWAARLVGAVVVAYAVSPIDLIPDFVPLAGYLDDLVLVPLGLLLVRRLIPPAVLAEHRERAARSETRLRSRVAGAVIVGVWILIAGLVLWRVLR